MYFSLENIFTFIYTDASFEKTCNTITKDKEMVTNITQENFNEVSTSQKPLVIDVYAPWCGPCQLMLPIFEELAKELSESYLFCKLNIAYHSL